MQNQGAGSPTGGGLLREVILQGVLTLKLYEPVVISI